MGHCNYYTHTSPKCSTLQHVQPKARVRPKRLLDYSLIHLLPNECVRRFRPAYKDHNLEIGLEHLLCSIRLICIAATYLLTFASNVKSQASSDAVKLSSLDQ
jgi:hypothetical protein